MDKEGKAVYNSLPEDIQEKIRYNIKNNIPSPYRTDDSSAVRRNMSRDIPNVWRPAFIRDCEKILHHPYFNRYADKTQVFSFYHNDDISRRALHVQLVSRIARNIGRALGLNTDLIEAIALGHDLGHPPFAHAGEKYLSEVFNSRTGKYFSHNVQSVRILDTVFRRNLTLQTLDGILCHNGENESGTMKPIGTLTFEEFDRKTELCYGEGLTPSETGNTAKKLLPATLEGCVVRISDIIAYLGKDRQDAIKTGIIESADEFASESIGNINAEIINNLSVDIIENSFEKDRISLSEKAFENLKKAKAENYSKIYHSDKVNTEYEPILKPMFGNMYFKLLNDLENKNENSYIYRHHIRFIKENTKYYDDYDYLSEQSDMIVTDYISSMTDDYFLDLYKILFPDSDYSVQFKKYFK